MDKEQIYEAIKSLASSQGFYRRLLEQIKDHPEILEALEYQNFKHPLDLINFLE